MISKPIIIIEDDPDDQDILREIFEELEVKNELIFFYDPILAMVHLKTNSKTPFLILCDINMPKQTGLPFKKEIDDDPVLKLKSIPFVFFTTSSSQYDVNKAYLEMTMQGYFPKSHNYENMKSTISAIITYWRLCLTPVPLLRAN